MNMKIDRSHETTNNFYFNISSNPPAPVTAPPASTPLVKDDYEDFINKNQFSNHQSLINFGNNGSSSNSNSSDNLFSEGFVLGKLEQQIEQKEQSLQNAEIASILGIGSNNMFGSSSFGGSDTYGLSSDGLSLDTISSLYGSGSNLDSFNTIDPLVALALGACSNNSYSSLGAGSMISNLMKLANGGFNTSNNQNSCNENSYDLYDSNSKDSALSFVTDSSNGNTNITEGVGYGLELNQSNNKVSALINGKTIATITGDPHVDFFDETGKVVKHVDFKQSLTMNKPNGSRTVVIPKQVDANNPNSETLADTVYDIEPGRRGQVSMSTNVSGKEPGGVVTKLITGDDARKARQLADSSTNQIDLNSDGSYVKKEGKEF